MLETVPLFAGVAPDRRERLAARSPVREVPAGSVVAVRGQPAERLRTEPGAVVILAPERLARRAGG